MKKHALLLSLLALGALGLVACGGGDDDAATAASETETARDRTSCGRVRVNGPYPPMKIAVVEGNVSCRVARGVMEDLYRGRGRLADAEHSPAPFYLVRGSWRCGGTDGAQACQKAQRTPSAKTIRTHPPVTGGGQAADATEASETKTTHAGLAADNKSWCPQFGQYRLAVDEGDISCRGARRVILDLANNTLPGSWSCTGDGTPDVVCTKEPGESARMVITAYFAGEGAPEADPGNNNNRLSNEERIEQARNEWQLLAGRHAVTEEGVPFSFRVPVGWERFSSISTDNSAGGPISINKSMTGPQGAEAIIFWTSFPDGDYADPCARLLSPPVGSSAADLAAAVSTAPGTELLTGPSNVTLGGRPAKHVALTVREDVGCDPGFFYRWRDVYGGALWPKTGVGDTIRVWIVDVDGTRLFIEAETAYGFGLEQEVQRIVESIRFE